MKFEDDDQGYFQTVRKENDKTMSYLFAFIVVVFFFGLFLFGMHRTQYVSDQAVSDNVIPVRDVMPEIGIANETSKK